MKSLRSHESSSHALTLIGAPGSGKGTLFNNLQTRTLGAVRKLLVVGTGEILRSEVERKTELGLRAEKIMAGGGLVPDHVMIPMVDTRMEEIARKSKRTMPVFDGFPRTEHQAYSHSNILEKHNFGNIAVEMHIPEKEFDTLSKRIAGRAQEAQARGEPVRKDDLDPEAVRKRLEIAKQTMGPILKHHHSRGELFVVDALADAETICDTVHSHILSVLGEGVLS